ncbi:MAG: hypothetical protein JST30_16245 [Armatimonadetes bacterium]|nr:hypothetical protein [Armatimonadota bacterium]
MEHRKTYAEALQDASLNSLFDVDEALEESARRAQEPESTDGDGQAERPGPSS